MPLVLLLASYSITTAYYMTPSFLHCNDTVYGFGDSTAGPIWSYKATDGAFLPHNTQLTNYPQGENLYSAVSWTSLGQRAIYWPLAKMAGPVCGYNMFNAAGFIITALITFGFVYWLIRNKWLAWLAGYAVSFVPYMQMRVGTGPSYAFSGILVAIFWLLLALFRKPSWKKAVGLGAVTAFCVYFDPYFVLYGALTAAAVLLGNGIYMAIRWLRNRKQATAARPIKQAIRMLALTAGVFIVLVSPYAVVQISSWSAVQQRVASVRGNVLYETTACSNYPYEYLLPFVLHPVPRLLGIDGIYKKIEIKLKNNFSCGIGEDTVGVSLTLISILGLTVLVLLWEHLNGRKLKKIWTTKTRVDKGVIYSLSALLLIGILFGLPPTRYLGIPTPMRLVLDVTTTWRTISRIFMLVNIAVVVLAAIALYYYLINRKISSRFKRIGFVVILAAIVIEYQAFPLFQGNTLTTFSYKKDTPAVYQWLKNQSNIKVIAEYPMESYGESDAPTYYLSMQFMHGKKLLNASSPESSMEPFRRSIKNIHDPQTIPALRALGVDAIVVNGVDQKFIDQYKQLEVGGVFAKPYHGLFNHTSVVNGDTSVVLSLAGVKYPAGGATIGILSQGFYRNLGIINYPTAWAYEAVNGATINMKKVDSGKISNLPAATNYCFSVRSSAVGETLSFRPEVDGKTVGNWTITNNYTRVKLNVANSIVLDNSQGSNMQITDLGCSTSEH